MSPTKPKSRTWLWHRRCENGASAQSCSIGFSKPRQRLGRARFFWKCANRTSPPNGCTFRAPSPSLVVANCTIVGLTKTRSLCGASCSVCARGRASAFAPSGLCARSGERTRSFGPARAFGRAHSLLRACMWHPYAIGQQRPMAHGSHGALWSECARPLFRPNLQRWEGRARGSRAGEPSP